MKNACIAIRGRADRYDGEIARVLDALLDGGYCIDKAFFFPTTNRMSLLRPS